MGGDRHHVVGIPSQVNGNLRDVLSGLHDGPPGEAVERPADQFAGVGIAVVHGSGPGYQDDQGHIGFLALRQGNGGIAVGDPAEAASGALRAEIGAAASLQLVRRDQHAGDCLVGLVHRIGPGGEDFHEQGVL